MTDMHMSSTLKIKSDYEKAQVKGTNILAPRVGHYAFQKYKIKTTAKGREVAIMETIWKPFTEYSFVENLVFEVAIRSFYSVNAIGPKHIDSIDLMDKMIIVKEVKLENDILSMKWDVLDENPIITKPQTLYNMAPMSYGDINNMNRRFGIDDSPNEDQAYDAPDDL